MSKTEGIKCFLGTSDVSKSVYLYDKEEISHLIWIKKHSFFLWEIAHGFSWNMKNENH